MVDANDTLLFYRDDLTTRTEYSGGAVAGIRLYDGPLSADEVARLAAELVPAAFSARRPLWDFDAIGQWAELNESDDHISWVRTAWDAFAPHLGDGTGYVNHFSGDEPPEQVRASYGSNLARLRQLKTTYDPANIFRMNPNISPA